MVNLNTSDQSLSTQLANVIKVATSTPTILATATGKLTGGEAYAAAADYDYGVGMWAYSKEEMNQLLSDDQLDFANNANRAIEIIKQNKPIIPKYTPQKYLQKCLSANVDSNGDIKALNNFSNDDELTGDIWNYADYDKYNAKDCAQIAGTKTGLILRTYVMDYFNTVSSACYYGNNNDSDIQAACNLVTLPNTDNMEN